MNIFSTIQRFAAYFVAKCRNSWEQKDELHFFFFLLQNREELQVVDFSCDEKWLLEYSTEQ